MNFSIGRQFFCNSAIRHSYTSTFLRGISTKQMNAFKDLQDRNKGPAVIVSDVNQIHFNLALEKYLMEVVKPKVPVFFWWQNDKNVVIGRHQNPWKECDLAKMKVDHVDLARRFSGGGAVYQDLGNSCFTFLIPEKQYRKTLNNDIILRVLTETFGIKGEASGRNDLVVNGKKFSGSAFKTIKDSTGDSNGLSLHHGTILINTDFTALQKYLTPNKLKLQSKGISSVSSRVINIAELSPSISHQTLLEPLVQEFQKAYNTAGDTFQSIMRINKDSEILGEKEFSSIYEQLTDWDWRFGKTPRFSNRIEKRFDWGTIDLNIDVKNGMIEDVKMFTDCLMPDIVPNIEEALKGVPHTTDAISKNLQNIVNNNHTEWETLIKDISNTLCEETTD